MAKTKNKARRKMRLARSGGSAAWKCEKCGSKRLVEVGELACYAANHKKYTRRIVALYMLCRKCDAITQVQPPNAAMSRREQPNDMAKTKSKTKRRTRSAPCPGSARPWQPIKTAPKQDYVEVDLWMQWGASPMTMGMADAFRVTEAYRKEGKWTHRHEGKEKALAEEYITHWMPIPKAPNARTEAPREQ